MNMSTNPSLIWPKDSFFCFFFNSMTHFGFVVISQIFESFRRFLVVFYGSDSIAVAHCPPIFVTH